MTIYFLQARDGGPIKVGCSENPLIRQRQIAALFPYPVELLVTFPGGRVSEGFLLAALKPLAVDPTREWHRSIGPMWRLVLDIMQGGRPAYLPSDDLLPIEELHRLAIAEFGSPEKALAGMGYSPTTAFKDALSRFSQGGGRARLEFHMALNRGLLPDYLADLHLPARQVNAA